METTRKTAMYVAKCKCGAGVGAEGDADQNRLEKLAPTGPHPVGVAYMNRMGFVVGACKACGALRYLKMVLGKYSAKHTCNAKCLASIGPSCECSCRGANHGRGNM